MLLVLGLKTAVMIDNQTPWWKRLLELAFLLVLFLAFNILFYLPLGFLAESLVLDHISSEIGMLLVEWSIMLIVSLASVWTIDRLIVKKGWALYGFSSANLLASLGIGARVASVILLACFALFWLLGYLHIERFDFQANMLLLWFVFFLIQPLTEEVVMRSFFQSHIQRLFGKYAGLLLSAAIFAFIHSANDHFTILGGLQILGGGLLMGLLYLHTRNIWAAFAMHAVWNFMQGILLGFPVSGMETYQLLHTRIEGPNWLTGGAFGLEGSVLSLLFILIAVVYYWREIDWN